MAGWAEDCGIDAERLPVFVLSFAHKQEQIRATYIDGNVELMIVILARIENTDDLQTITAHSRAT